MPIEEERPWLSFLIGIELCIIIEEEETEEEREEEDNPREEEEDPKLLEVGFLSGLSPLTASRYLAK